MQRRALVTGGAGFIGSHLVHLLASEGWRVRVLDNLSTGHRENVPGQAEFIEGDLRDPIVARSACSGVDTVFHLAARVSVRDSLDHLVEHNTTNVTATLVLLKAAATAGVRRLVFTSSMAVYDEGLPNQTIDERHPTRPLSPYGISKLAAEKYLLQAGPALGLQPVILRLFNTYGPGQAYSAYVGVVTIFITRLLQGLPLVVYGDGQQCRDFVYVGDVAQACLSAALSEAAVGECFNIGSGRGITVNQLVELISSSLGAAQPIIEYQPAQAGELRYSIANVHCAQQALNYNPTSTFEHRLPEVIDWIRAQL
jgi:UDP-glucose 4-epimerase